MAQRQRCVKSRKGRLWQRGRLRCVTLLLVTQDCRSKLPLQIEQLKPLWRRWVANLKQSSLQNRTKSQCFLSKVTLCCPNPAMSQPKWDILINFRLMILFLLMNCWTLTTSEGHKKQLLTQHTKTVEMVKVWQISKIEFSRVLLLHEHKRRWEFHLTNICFWTYVKSNTNLTRPSPTKSTSLF